MTIFSVMMVVICMSTSLRAERLATSMLRKGEDKLGPVQFLEESSSGNDVSAVFDKLSETMDKLTHMVEQSDKKENETVVIPDSKNIEQNKDSSDGDDDEAAWDIFERRIDHCLSMIGGVVATHLDSTLKSVRPHIDVACDVLKAVRFPKLRWRGMTKEQADRHSGAGKVLYFSALKAPVFRCLCEFYGPGFS